MLPPLHNIILFELHFKVKFPLLRLLQIQSDLKSNILVKNLPVQPIAASPQIIQISLP